MSDDPQRARGGPMDFASEATVVLAPEQYRQVTLAVIENVRRLMEAMHAEVYDGGPGDGGPFVQGIHAAALAQMVEAGMTEAQIRLSMGRMTDELLPQFLAQVAEQRAQWQGGEPQGNA